MARTALTQLQEQIEAVRREAFAAGYAAAMQAVRDLAGRPAPGAESAAAATARPRGRRPAAPRPAAPAPQPEPRRGRPPGQGRRRRGTRATSSAPRPQRGTNARLVEEVLQSFAPRAARPAEIRTALQRDKGVAMAFTSIRHALGQLEARRTVEHSDGNTWRYLGQGASAD